LIRFAFRAQERGGVSDGAQVRLRESDARTLIDHDQSPRIIRAGVDLTVLDKLGRDIQFFHQLLQEFFAARQLAAEPNPELIRREWRADHVSPSLAEKIASLSDSDPLPPLPTTGWEQTALLAVTMASAPDKLVRSLINADLPTAARCAAQPDAKVSAALKDELRQMLIARTQDMTADLRHRIDVGLALGELGDPRFERRTGPHGNYLLPPGSVTTGAGSPYKIYTPFAKAARERLPARPVLDPPRLSHPAEWPKSDELADWNLLPAKPDWAGGMRKAWDCGEDAALSALEDFVAHAARYEGERNLPSGAGTSRLSPHLHWGEISPGQVWEALEGRSGEGVETFRGELLWRDYAQNVIAQFPNYADQAHREDFRQFPWRRSSADLRAWRQGQTGYPIVDA
jgi:hypothetical protein